MNLIPSLCSLFRFSHRSVHLLLSDLLSTVSFLPLTSILISFLIYNEIRSYDTGLLFDFSELSSDVNSIFASVYDVQRRLKGLTFEHFVMVFALYASQGKAEGLMVNC